ncbi:MAG: DUF2330 domain-containing protein [Verrucomicrobiota bacterium]
MSSMLLPALGSAGAVVGVASGVTELATARVGAFETTTITARSSTALMGWLRANQFGVPANTEPVIADYVKRGWVFVASKLARDAAANATNSIHPLSFTFRTEQPVYPLRLTGVDNGPLQVELYVFGPDRAEAERFKVSACASLAFPSQSSGWYRVDSLGTELSAMHPVLRAWAADCRVATKLTASLSPAQMHDDVVIRWSPFQPGREVVYSWRGALITAAGWGTGVMLGGFVLALLALWIRGGWRSVLPRAARWIVALAALTLVAVLAFVPKVSVRSERFRPVSARIALERFADRVLARWTASPPKTIEQARLAVIFEPGMTTNNIYLGGVIREEDSPGNYVIRQTTNGFEVHWYDAYGSEHTRERP